jgi:uncharacterized oligopeptide transporter (OPT) family protein
MIGQTNIKHHNMAEEQDSVNDFAEKVKGQLAAYVDVKIELLKAQWVEKAALILGKLVTGLVVMFLLFFTILFSSLVAGYYFGQVFGSTTKGFGVIALFYLIVLLVIVIFRKKMIQLPLSDFIVTTIYQENDED